jgi:hypothetical protein
VNDIFISRGLTGHDLNVQEVDEGVNDDSKSIVSKFYDKQIDQILDECQHYHHISHMET